MRKQAYFAAALAILAALCLGAYLRWVNPEINAPLGLDHFNEADIRGRVQATAQSLLEGNAGVELHLNQKLEVPKLKRMQELFGIRATSYWTRKDVPVQRWIYRATLPQKLSDLKFFKEPEAPLTVEVDSSGQIQALTIPPRKGGQAGKLTAEQARAVAEDALRFAGVDVGRLTLTATTQGDTEGQQTFDFAWKEAVTNLPGMVYQYSVRLQSGYLNSFRRDIVFAEEAPQSLWQDLVSPLLTGAAWLFLALVLLTLFVQRLRRDEIDFHRARKIGLLAALLAFMRFASEPTGGLFQALAGGALIAVVAALFFGALWAVTESLLRDSCNAKLRFVDLMFDGHLKVREMGRHVIGSAAWATTFLGVPVFLLAAATQWRGLNLVLLPVDLELGNLRFPGGLMGNALLGPLPGVTVIGCVFLGIVYPLTRSRLQAGTTAVIFCILFALATARLIPVGPPAVAFTLALIVGGALFLVMEQSGLLAGLILLYVPQAFRGVALLASAKYPTMSFQGWICVGILAGLLALATLVALFGRTQAGLDAYIPDYLQRIRERERFARELEIAKGIQDRFLPKTTPDIPGFSLATRCVPAMEVGGDYYDFLPLPDGRWLMLIGDVSGKGVRAAFYMTLTKGILHAITGGESDHVEILRRLNGIFGKLGESGIFLTMCAVVLDPETRGVQILSAGHNPPFLVRPELVETLQPRGLVLGVMGDDFFVKSLEIVTLTLAPGHALVLYTDGVTEAMDRRENEFGMERLQEALEGARPSGAHGLVEAVLNSVARFQRGARQTDDLTLLVLESHEA